jgi:hypothetical protein
MQFEADQARSGGGRYVCIIGDRNSVSVFQDTIFQGILSQLQLQFNYNKTF